MSEVEQKEQINQEELGKAMNLVGQTLYSALGQSLQQLPEELQNTQVILQGISGFLANLMHQQAPNQLSVSREMLETVYKLASAHLDEIAPLS